MVESARSVTARVLGKVAALHGLLGAPRLSVLIFHRVHPQPDPLFAGEMHAELFDRICGQLAQAVDICTLSDGVARLGQARPGGRASVAITFDDGYADNAVVALPILRKHGLKATFYVTTGFLDGGRMWNDTVIEAIRATRQERLSISELGIFDLPLQTLDQRRRAIDVLLPKVKYLGLAEREQVLNRLVSELGRPRLPSDLMMSTDQVRLLHACGMEVGGHTVRHPILRTLLDEEAELEIREGRNRLEAIIDAPVSSFAYPNGGPDRDYDLRHVAMVQRAGFANAVTTARGVVTPEASPFQLPRFSPWDLDPTRWIGRLLATHMGSAAHRVAAQHQP